MGIFSGGKNKIKSKNNQTRFQKNLGKKTRKAVDKYWKKTGPKGVQLPKTPMVEPFNPLQTQGQQAALAAVPGMQNVANAGANFTTNLLGQDPSTAGRDNIVLDQPATEANPGYDKEAMDFLLHKVLYPGSNPALQGAIDAAVRPIQENLLETTLPTIRGGAVTSGNFGSSRQGIAEGQASGRASQAIGDTSANLANEGYKAGLGALTTTFGNIANNDTARYGTLVDANTARYGTQQGALSNLYNTNVNSQLNALGLLPQTQNSLLTPALVTSGVGDVRQGQGQAERDENVYRHLFSQTSPLISAQGLTQLGNAQRGGSATTTQDLPDTNPLMAGLGVAGTAASLFPNAGRTLGNVLKL